MPLTYFCTVHFILRATLLNAERLASAAADTILEVFGMTRLRIKPSLSASKANALTTRPRRWYLKQQRKLLRNGQKQWVRYLEHT